MKQNHDDILTAVNAVINDQATATIHHGDGHHKAVRLTGCTSDVAQSLLPDVVEALRPFCGAPGYPSATRDATLPLVWYS